eukprot:scaffold26115_cov132-Cylindrotheca_fusiformis.AAC.3
MRIPKPFRRQSRSSRSVMAGSNLMMIPRKRFINDKIYIAAAVVDGPNEECEVSIVPETRDEWNDGQNLKRDDSGIVWISAKNSSISQLANGSSSGRKEAAAAPNIVSTDDSSPPPPTTTILPKEVPLSSSRGHHQGIDKSKEYLVRVNSSDSLETITFSSPHALDEESDIIFKEYGAMMMMMEDDDKDEEEQSSKTTETVKTLETGVTSYEKSDEEVKPVPLPRIICCQARTISATENGLRLIQ